MADVSLNLRKFPEEYRDIARKAASARGLTMGEYVVALIELHARLIERELAGDKSAREALATSHLRAVTN